MEPSPSGPEARGLEANGLCPRGEAAGLGQGSPPGCPGPWLLLWEASLWYPYVYTLCDTL